MITMAQVNKLRSLHDAEKKAYEATHTDYSLSIYNDWVKKCDELNRFIETIAGDA